jgi:hypothetical protein
VLAGRAGITISHLRIMINELEIVISQAGIEIRPLQKAWTPVRRSERGPVAEPTPQLDLRGWPLVKKPRISS